MQHRLLLVIAFVSLSLACIAQTTRRVLFLGNSYTYFNNMPQTVANMATSIGDVLTFDMHAPGGFTIDNHSTSTTTRNKITQGNWDYVVIQEQSQLPSFPGYFANGLHGIAENIRNNSPCGRIMFYMTWGRKNGDAANCVNWPPVCTYLGMDSLIRLSYTDMAQTHYGELSPVGAAWRYVRQHHPGINLYEPDESHPSAAGSYLVACCFYTSIFKKNPLSVTHNAGISASDAAILRQAAKIVVFDSLAHWDHSAGAPTANFAYSIGSGTNQVVCTNYSSDYADSYLWNFGDGNTSTQKHPTHSYANNGTYTITLTAYNCDLNTTHQGSFQRTVTFCAHTPIITPASLMMCPGANDTLWTQHADAYQWYDVNGNAIPGANQQYIACAPSNTYSVRTTQNGCTELSKPAEVLGHGNMSIWYIHADGNLIGADTACIGDSLTLLMWFNKPPYPPDQYIDWYKDGQQIAGYHNDSLVIKTTGTYAARLRHQFCTNLDQTKQQTYTFVHCNTNVAEQAKGQALTVYPNPSADGMYTLENGADADIIVVDVLGKDLLRANLEKGRHNIDLSGQPAGIYLLHSKDENGTNSVKLVKQ